MKFMLVVKQKKFPRFASILINLVIDVSGTAFDYIEQYGDTNRFVWTYYNNVKYCEENNLPYSKINLSVAKYDTEFKQYHPDAPDSITNLFDLNDAKDDFRYPALVMAFINEHLIVGKNPKLLASQYTLCNSKHIYCALPSIKACDLICEYIKKSDCIYEPMSCHGDSKKGFEQINAHLNVILTPFASLFLQMFWVSLHHGILLCSSVRENLSLSSFRWHCEHHLIPKRMHW